MKKTIQPSTPPPPGRSLNDCLSFGLLREIRAAAQYLQTLMAETIEVASTLDDQGKQELLERALGTGMQARINWTISRNLEKFEKLFDDDCVQRDWCSDSIEIIRLHWHQVMDLWPTAPLTYEEQARGIERAQVFLDRIVYECASLTLSPRIADTLNNVRVGQPLDWDFRFASELPRDKELSQRLLSEMAQEGGVLEGAIVDVEQRVIYKVARSRWAQRLSAFKLAGILVLLGLIVPYILSWIGTQTDQWPLGWGDLSRLYATYAFIFLGAGAHFAIDALKAARAQTRPNFQALDDWILWLHIRYNSIRWSLLWILLGYLLLSVAGPQISWQSAFLAGYSIDSVVDLFLARFETTIKAKTQDLLGAKSAG